VESEAKCGFTSKASTRHTKGSLNGKTKKYYYAWKNGPRVDAEPGTPEFVRLYGEACKKKPAADTMRSLIDYFKDSDEYKVGSIHSRRAYNQYLKLIDGKFGTMPIAAIEDKRARGEFKIRGEVMPAIDVIRSATLIGAEVVRQEGKLGTIAPGALADMIVVDRDPLKDLGLFQDAGKHLPAIVKGGQFHKNAL